MAGQQIVFAETVIAMKRALARNDDASESDNSITIPTNRGNKLKRKAKYVQEGRLNQADGPRVYRRKLNYNGFSRYIISHNPPRVDLDGDIIEDDDADEAAELSPAEDDPYADIKLEEVLMPLTSAANLHTHPSLSKVYYSKNLDEMVRNIEDMVRREQASLWKAKQMLTKFRGDATWMPCGMMESDHDIFVFGQQHIGTNLAASSGKVEVELPELPAATWETISTGRLVTDVEDTAGSEKNRASMLTRSIKPDHENLDATIITSHPNFPNMTNSNETRTNEQNLADDHTSGLNKADGSIEMADQPTETDVNFHADQLEEGLDGTAATADKEHLTSTETTHTEPDEINDIDAGAINNGTTSAEQSAGAEITPVDGNGDQSAAIDGSDPEDEDAERPTHRMTTRARAQAATDNDPSTPAISGSPTPSIPFVHPFFSVPSQALPDADFGLPPDEADKTRRLLMMYVQKQEEVCRGVLRLYDGLLKALRLRKTVLRWCKAEGHVGELEDGEDWYDLEEWGLDEDLKKGEEQEDDDGGIVGPHKKTRRARAAA